MLSYIFILSILLSNVSCDFLALIAISVILLVCALYQLKLIQLNKIY